MTLSLFLQGFWIGFAISAPVGPVGIIVIRRTLAEGLLAGTVSGLGCGLVIALYGSIAGFGLTAISGFLIDQKFWFSLFGSLLLIYLGLLIFRASPPDTTVTPERGSLLNAFTSTFILSLFSPALLLYFLAIFANTDLLQTGTDYATASLLVFSTFLGSFLWWVVLSLLVSLLRSRLNRRWLQWANWLSGLAIAAFGLRILWGLWPR